jgi:arylformamidase
MKMTYVIAVCLLLTPSVYGTSKNRAHPKKVCPKQFGFTMSESMFEEQKPMKIYDISWPLFNGISTYKDKGIFKREETRTWEKDKSRESLITMGSHIGTHIDAPTHFLEKGKTIDQLELTKLMGSCKIIDLTDIPFKKAITADDLKRHELAPRLLLKTRNSELKADEKFNPDFIYIDKTAAKYLVEHNVICVGIDYLGIETKQPNHETHQQLLENEIVIIEGLRLADVEAGDYFLSCMPLALVGSDAAPARAVLVAEE